MTKVIITILLSFLLLSCSKNRKQVSEQEYANWLTKQHPFLFKQKDLGDIKVELKLEPSESIYVKNKGETSSFEDYKSMLAFQLRLSNHSGVAMLKYDAKEEKDYQERIYYYTNQVKKHLTIEQEGIEEIFATDVIIDRSYGLAPTLTLNILFKPVLLDKPLTLHFDERVFNLGLLNFHYSLDELNQIPTLEYK